MMNHFSKWQKMSKLHMTVNDNNEDLCFMMELSTMFAHRFPIVNYMLCNHIHSKHKIIAYEMRKMQCQQTSAENYNIFFL